MFDKLDSDIPIALFDYFLHCICPNDVLPRSYAMGYKALVSR